MNKLLFLFPLFQLPIVISRLSAWRSIELCDNGFGPREWSMREISCGIWCFCSQNWTNFVNFQFHNSCNHVGVWNVHVHCQSPSPNPGAFEFHQYERLLLEVLNPRLLPWNSICGNVFIITIAINALASVVLWKITASLTSWRHYFKVDCFLLSMWIRTSIVNSNNRRRYRKLSFLSDKKKWWKVSCYFSLCSFNRFLKSSYVV